MVVGNEQDYIFRVSVAKVDTGLVRANLETRSKRRQLLHELMSAWKDRAEVPTAERLESTVASLYCQTFLDTLGRPPTPRIVLQSFMQASRVLTSIRTHLSSSVQFPVKPVPKA